MGRAAQRESFGAPKGQRVKWTPALKAVWNAAVDKAGANGGKVTEGLRKLNDISSGDKQVTLSSTLLPGRACVRAGRRSGGGRAPAAEEAADARGAAGLLRFEFGRGRAQRQHRGAGRAMIRDIVVILKFDL